MLAAAGGDDSDDTEDGGDDGQIVIRHGRLPGSMLHLPPAADWSQHTNTPGITFCFCSSSGGEMPGPAAVN